MPPPSDDGAARRERRAVRGILGVIVAAGIGVAFAYAALNPVRLMAQARYLGPANAPEYAHAGVTVHADLPCPQCPPESENNAAGPTGYDTTVRLPDGRRTVALRNIEPDDPETAQPVRRHLVLESADVPDSSVTLTTRPPAEMRSLVGVTDELELVGTSAAPMDKTVSSDLAAESQKVLLFRVGIVGNRAAPRRIVAHQPAPGAIREMVLSSHDDHILWVIRGQRRPWQVVQWAAKKLKPLSRFAAIRYVTTVWQTDGVGASPIKVADEPEQNETAAHRAARIPHAFAWEPDGKHIRFAFGANEYDVPSPTRN